MSRLWPASEAAQADYETLREQALRGQGELSLAAARFARLGLAGLIARPTGEPIWVASLVAIRRPPWSPHLDPRAEALADGYASLLAIGVERPACDERQEA